MEISLGTNSHFATLGNGVSGGALNMKGDIFSQQTRLIICGRSGAKYQYVELFFC